MNLRFAHVQKSLSSAPVQSCCPQRALFQVYISYSMQKGQASSCKMYTRGEIFIEICRFLVKLQAFCRILTKPEASAIFFTDSGRKPDARTEARVLHPDGAFYLFVKAMCEDAHEFCEKAKDYELLLVPADSFGTPGYVRVSYCVQTKQIEDALPAFEALAKNYK